jgi:DNA processing protein
MHLNSPPFGGKTDCDIYSWLQLIRTERIGPITFWQLLSRYGSAKHALDTLDRFTAQNKNLKGKLASEKDVETELNNHRKSGFVLIPTFSNDFPKLLKTLPDCPPLLSVYGQLSVLNVPTLGIVGSRNASLAGRQFAQNLANNLGGKGWKIVSGLARGIDCHAHQGSIDYGTIAVVAGGVDVIYPPEHKKLYHEISRTGAVISEMPLSMFPAPGHFPRRNRLISGLSQGVIIVEAALRSGSLITARTALEQGREIFAVPGSPLDPRCRGTNDLIRQGAALIECAEDVLSVISNPCMTAQFRKIEHPDGHMPLPNPAPALTDIDWNDLEKNVFQDLSLIPLSVDMLVERYSVSAQTILTLILEWELQGRIQRHPGNKVALAS